MSNQDWEISSPDSIVNENIKNANNKKWLKSQYTKLKKSIRHIAEDVGVSKSYIYDRLKKFGIERRNKSESILNAHKQNRLGNFIRLSCPECHEANWSGYTVIKKTSEHSFKCSKCGHTWVDKK